MATKLLDGVTADVALGSITMYKVRDICRTNAWKTLLTVRSDDFGGGTVTIYGGFEADGSDAVPLENGEFTENLGRVFDVPREAYIGATFTGSTSPDALTVTAAGD